MSDFQAPNGGHFKFRGKKKKSKVVLIIIVIVAILLFILIFHDSLIELLTYDSKNDIKERHASESQFGEVYTENDSSIDTQAQKQSSELFYPKEAVEFDSHMYCFYEISLSWTEAENYCQGLGGHLVSINSSEEQLFVESLTESSSKNNIWIGGYLENGSWRWNDDTSFAYQNWDIEKPDNYQDNEFFLRYANADLVFSTWSAFKGKWDDCAENASGDDSDATLSSFGFVCEWVKK